MNRHDLLKLKGTPLPQDASFDELRLKDVPQGAEVQPGQRLDPLLHYAGRAHVAFREESAPVTATDLRPYIDHAAKTVTSTTGELRLDYGNGVLRLQSPRAQGLSGNLQAAGKTVLPAIEIDCEMDLAHIVAVPLDGQPLASSQRILLQVMSEEQTTGFATEPVDAQSKRITNIGRDPWQVKKFRGNVAFTRKDASHLKVTALDFTGRPEKLVGTADKLSLQPDTLYYLIAP